MHALALSLWLAATGGAYLARDSERPLTAALLYLFGVTLIGALEGLRGGIGAAVASSIFYNFFLSDPVFRFSLSSADEYAPLIAFNASAAASGFLAGRLKDRALAAEAATRQIRALLEVSQRLQAAVGAEDLPLALAAFPALGSIELFAARDGRLDPIAAGSPDGAELARQAWSSGGEVRGGGRQAWLLSTGASPCGVLVASSLDGRSDLKRDMRGAVNLLGLALERCLLRERLSEAELVHRSEALKTALLSSVSHDLRTPLSAIAASASSLAHYGSELGEETRANLLQMIREQCDRLNRYTTNLLNLGRIHAGVDQRQFTLCDLVEVLGAALSNIRAEGGDREIRKDYSIDPTTLVRADPVMLEQVFFNVLDNAIRYSPQGSPILIRAEVSSGRLTVSISDCGPGIAPSEAELVFERFYRSSSSKAAQGNGLGLSIASGFTEAFGGTIEALAGEPPFAGACIRITLPVERAEDLAA